MKMLLDTCTTWTIVTNPDILTNTRPEGGRLTGCTRGDSGARVTTTGTLQGTLEHNGMMTEITISNVKATAEVEEPMLRVQQLHENGLSANYENKKITDRRTGEVKAEIHEDEYRLPFIWVYYDMKGRSNRVIPDKQQQNIQHKRHGHLGGGAKDCKDCRQARATKKKMRRKEETKNYKFGELLSMDTDVFSSRSLEGYLYRQDVIDHGTCWMWGLGMKKKNQHEQFLRDILAETKDAIKEFRVDGAKEFRGTMMKTLAREFRFRITKAARYTHEHMAKVERSHRTIDEMARAMMNTANLPHDLFWSLAGQAAIYTKNRIPTKGNEGNLSPYEARFGTKPDCDKLKVFGCKVIVHLSKEGGRKKMENPGEEGMFVGYPDDGAGYLVMNLDTMQTRTEGVVEFYEDEFPGKNVNWTEILPDDSDDDYREEEMDSTSDSEEDRYNNEESVYGIENNDATMTSSEDDEPEAGKRARLRHQKQPDRGVMVSYATREDKTKMNYRQAMQSNDREIYKHAIRTYLEDLLDQGAIEIVPRDDQPNTIGSRWVCCKKYVNGKFKKYKVRWTPLGYMQKKGIDYSDTFAPVALSASNRLIYVIAAKWNRKVKKGDVENAFQKTMNTQHTIYAELCEGMDLIYPELEKKHYVMKLNHAINGTKQSGREFNVKLDRILLSELGMRRIRGDACLYSIGHENDGTQLIATFHVDDYQYVGMTDKVEEEFVKKMKKQLPSKVGNVCTEHLGMEINQKDDGSTEFTQKTKIIEYCEEFQVTGQSTRIRTMNFNGSRSPAMLNPEKYPKAMGCINYLVHNSRPDVSAVASLLASYTRSPKTANWKGVSDLLTYLKGTKEKALIYRKPDEDEQKLLKIEGYCDASYNSPNENLEKKRTRSRAGYLLFVNGCLIKWYSKVIRLTVQSTEEAEVIAANELCRDVKWLTGILCSLGVPFAKPVICCDSDNAISWIKNRGVTDRSKHFATKLNMVKESYDQQEFDIERIAGEDNPADLMTKQLGRNKIEQHCAKMGMIDGTEHTHQKLGGSVGIMSQ